ncbi:MAG TPA: histidine kinase dimerization/phospho-acceptor domain-containing protein [Candidatus Acidoferrales bacterium]|nr:histidine kinase dimerization/phospho-acceptor domain-containing protein [Candidatus Acidoferrales bacterium]
MKNQQTVILLSADAQLSQQYLEELPSPESGVAVVLVGSLREAREAMARREPDAVLIDESAVTQGSLHPSVSDGSLRKAAVYMSRLASVVVVASPERQSEMAELIAAGVADFVSRVGPFVPLAAALMERRLRQCAFPAPPVQKEGAEEDFGEILRHEVNNPLTGILGNAELLLAELRRRPDNSMPQTAQQRLQTIADLAVRLRETVRRLSDDLQNRDLHARMP